MINIVSLTRGLHQNVDYGDARYLTYSSISRFSVGYCGNSTVRNFDDILIFIRKKSDERWSKLRKKAIFCFFHVPQGFFDIRKRILSSIFLLQYIKLCPLVFLNFSRIFVFIYSCFEPIFLHLKKELAFNLLAL